MPAPYHLGFPQDRKVESRFRLVGPMWSQTLIHKSWGMKEKNRMRNADWNRKGRWRRVSQIHSEGYEKYLLPRGVQNTRWTLLCDQAEHQLGLC